VAAPAADDARRALVRRWGVVLGRIVAVVIAIVGVIVTVHGVAPISASAQEAPTQDVPPPLRVAGIADVELFRGAEVGARARLEALNAAGGIDGRRVEFLGVSDDHRDAATAAAETKRLVRDVGVDAVVPVLSSRFTDAGVLAEARVPAFGWGIAGGFCGSRWAFAITGCRAALLPREVPGIWGELVASVVRARGVSRPTAAIVTEAAGVPRALDELRAVARAAGFRVTSAEAALGSGESAAAGVDAIGDAIVAAGGDPPDAVFAVAGYTAVGALQDALRARSYAGVMTNLVQYSPALAAPAAGAYVLTEFATPESAPDNPRMQEILAQLAPLTTEAVTPSMLAGWFAADLWVRAVEEAGADASPARVAREAARLRYRVPRTVGPTRFPAAFVEPTSCGQLVTSDGAAFSVAAPYRCSGYVRVPE
jgi:ABC-type branched-subunit amino acid transport system substrate-binding protein